MKTVYLIARELTDRDSVHESLARQLSFPAHYGKNLDALHDAISEKAPCRVIIVGEPELWKTLGEWYHRFLQVLSDAGALAIARTEPDVTLEEAQKQLYDLQARLAAYNHASALIYYDGATTAPRGAGENRARTMGVLAQEQYDISTGPETVKLLSYLDDRQGELTAEERRMVYLMLKDIRQLQKIPREEYTALQMLLVQADDVWHRAKEDSDFALFEPYLEKIFAAYKRVAGYCAPEKDPYDYWLGEFEEGIDRKTCDAFFAALREKIVPLLHRVMEKPQIPNDLIKGRFNVRDQKKLSGVLMDLIGLDPDHVVLGETEHPFTTSLGSHLDERITTHYYEEDVSFSMFSVIHEGGHALYDTGCREEFAFTVLDGGVSMGIHESQSRFYENLLGRSRAFCETIFPTLRALFPAEFRGHTPEDLYRAVNRAEPSLIRTEADELTYSLHVMIRYELEKRLFDGDLQVHDLPEAWNAMYKEYLGIDVPDDKHGVLQDSHWAGGNIGYFPSYALGSAYGAQLLAKMKETVDVDACIRKGDFGPINDWNREHIWNFGGLYPPGELFRMAAGADFDPKYYTDYLEKKFTELYDL